MVNLTSQKQEQDIRELVSNYRQKRMERRDWVQYAGPYFTDEEFVKTIECLLGGWLVLGERGIRFERKFKTWFDKSYGALTNSGSSANLLMISALKSKRLYDFKEGTKKLSPQWQGSRLH